MQYLNELFSGKILDKKTELLNQASKSSQPAVTNSPPQHPLTQTIVNSVTNNKRKSSETVTSSEEELETLKVESGSAESKDSPAEARKCLMSALGEDDEEEESAEAAPSEDPKLDFKPQSEKPASVSDSADVDKSTDEKPTAASEEPKPVSVTESEDLQEKKVNFS